MWVGSAVSPLSSTMPRFRAARQGLARGHRTSKRPMSKPRPVIIGEPDAIRSIAALEFGGDQGGRRRGASRRGHGWRPRDDRLARARGPRRAITTVGREKRGGLPRRRSSRRISIRRLVRPSPSISGSVLIVMAVTRPGARVLGIGDRRGVARPRDADLERARVVALEHERLGVGVDVLAQVPLVAQQRHTRPFCPTSGFAMTG